MSAGAEHRAVASGVKWAFVSQAGMRAAQLATTAVLARLLEPADFGLVGMALAVVFLVDVFKDLGTTSALVQRQTLEEPLLSSVFWIQLGIGLLAALAVTSLAPIAAAAYGAAEVEALLRWLAWVFVASALGLTHHTLLTRELAFDRLARCEIGATLLAAVVGIGAAFAGAGAMSLVLQSLVFAVASTVLLWIARPWRPRGVFSWTAVRPITGYSLNLTGHSVVNYAARHADTLLVGALLGPVMLGFYNMAYRVMLLPLDSFSRVLGRVMFPTLSRLQGDDARFSRVYLRWVTSVAFVTFPAMLGLAVIAEPLVITVLGEKWRPLVPLLWILAPVGALQSVVATVGTVFKARDATARMLRLGVLGSAVSVACYAMGTFWGIEGVAAGCAVATLLMAWPNFQRSLSLFGLPVSSLLHALRVPALNAGLMLTTLLLVREGLDLYGDAWQNALLLVVVGVAVYSAAALASARDTLRELWGSVRASV